MAIDRLTQKIIEDAEAEVTEIRASGDEEIEIVKADTARAIAEVEKRAQEDGDTEAAELRRRILSRAQAEMRKELLADKQELIGQAFQEAFQSLVDLDERSYAKLMKKLLLESLERGDEEVIVAPEDRGRGWDAVLSEVNRELSARNMKGAVTLSDESRPMAAGFMLRKGKKEINCALDLVVNSLREELEFEVARTLFGETPS